MSEHLLKILLKELKILRLTCKCGGVVELGIEKFEEMKHDLPCPGCGQPMRNSRMKQGDAFHYLAHALNELHQLANRITIEFVLPEKTDAKP